MELEEKTITGTEVIVLKFPYGEFTLMEIRDRFDELKSIFPDRAIVALPQEFTLETFSIEELEEIVNNLRDYVNAIKKEK